MRYIFITLVVFASFGLNAQDATLAKYKAMFTLNFVRYIGWPEEAKQGDFVIGVVRDAMVLDNLKKQTVGKKFGYQNIVVKEFKKIDEITDCQILYFSNSYSYSKNAAIVKQKLGNKNSLIVTEQNGAITNGSMINFVIKDDKLKFEVSTKNASSFGVKLSNSLTSLSNAIVIN